jgi:hypothetical protein
MDSFLPVFFFVGLIFVIIYGIVIPVGEIKEDVRQIKEQFISKKMEKW